MTKICSTLVLCLLLMPLAWRAALSHFETVPTTRSIYQQQYQMGRFLHRFYEDESVAANDIGAINYLARLHCFDLWGLGTKEVMENRRHGTYSTAVIREMADQRKVRIAIAYPGWFASIGEPLPKEWIVVGSWTNSADVPIIGYSDTVVFYAVDPVAASKLRANLRVFARELPPEVTWKESPPPPAGD